MKRARREEKDPRPAKMELLRSALKSKETTMPTPEAREILLGSLEVALKGEYDERHEFQTSIAKMIETTLLSHRQHLEGDLAAKKQFLEDASDTKDQLDHRVKETEQAIVAKKQDIEEKKAMKNQDDAAVKQMNVGLEKAKTAEKALEKKRGGLAGEQTKLIDIYDTCFEVLRDAPPKKKDAEKLLGSLMVMLKSLGGDASMHRGLPLAIMKAPDTRGDFDNMAISAVDQLFAKAKQSMLEKIHMHDEDAARAATFTSEAQMAADTAQQKLDNTIEVHGTAQSDLKELEKALKAAKSEVTKHEAKVAETGEELHEAQGKIQDFERVEEAFEFLNTFSTKKAEAPDEEVEQQGAGEEEEEDLEEEEEQQME